MVKKLIRGLLPHFIIARYDRQKKSSAPAAYMKYLDMGNSILQSHFSITVEGQQERKFVTIGDDNMLNCQIIFESDEGEVIIGNRVFIGASTLISRERIEFGNNIFVAWGVCFYDHDSHSLDHKMRQEDISQQLRDYRNGQSFIQNKNWKTVKSAPIKISDNAWIGMNALILKGVTIGEGAVVGAGSVVTRDVEPWTVVGGNPAKLIRRIDK